VRTIPASILVVEDNEANLSLIDYLLRAYGFTPLLARSGAEGLRIALKERPDVVLLDIRMPGMDGYELAAAIKRVPALEQTRVVAVTASAMVGDRERIAAAGFDGYIQKPIDPETFMGTLEQLLPARPAARYAAVDKR
jgi:CheY-like chemotaxis protein